MNDSKVWYTSKTLWWNIVGGIVSVATAFGLDIPIDEEAKTALVGGVLTVINIWLRFKTTSPVSVTRG